MEWYNPLTWFGKSRKAFVEPEVKEIILSCDNPQCRAPIKDMEIVYNEEQKEIYHIGGCGMFANAYRAMSFGYGEVSNVDYITTEEALELFLNKRLRQSEILEQRV